LLLIAGKGEEVTTLFVGIIAAAVISSLVASQWKSPKRWLIWSVAAYVAVAATILFCYRNDDNLDATAWFTALAGLTVVIYTFVTWRMASVAADDLEMRTRPVVTLEVEPLVLNGGETHQFWTEMLWDLRVFTVLRNHTNLHGYAWIRFEYWKACRESSGSDWKAEPLGVKPNGDDYSGEERLDVPAMYKLEGHTSLGNQELKSEIRKKLAAGEGSQEGSPAGDLFLVVKTKSSSTETLKPDDPITTVAYRLKFQFMNIAGNDATEKGEPITEVRAFIEMVPFQTSYPFKSDWDDSHRRSS
jgi:hypothetical protein